MSSRLLEYETVWYKVMERVEVIASGDLDYWAKMQPGGNSINLKIRVMLEEKIYFEPPAEARVQRQVLHPGSLPRPQADHDAESAGDRRRVGGGPGGGRGDGAAAARGAARPPDPRGAARAAVLLDAALPHQCSSIEKRRFTLEAAMIAKKTAEILEPLQEGRWSWSRGAGVAAEGAASHCPRRRWQSATRSSTTCTGLTSRRRPSYTRGDEERLIVHRDKDLRLGQRIGGLCLLIINFQLH